MAPIEKRFTGKSEIWLDEEGILRVRPVAGAEIDLEETIRCFEVYEQLGCRERKVLQLLEGQADFSVTAESRDYSAKHGKDFFIAAAIISKSIPARLIVNFFNSFYKTKVPFKMFGTEEAALKWLRTFRKKESGGTTINTSALQL